MQIEPATAEFLAQRSGGVDFQSPTSRTRRSTSPTAPTTCATCSTATTTTRRSRSRRTTAARPTSTAGWRRPTPRTCASPSTRSRSRRRAPTCKRVEQRAARVRAALRPERARQRLTSRLPRRAQDEAAVAHEVAHAHRAARRRGSACPCSGRRSASACRARSRPRSGRVVLKLPWAVPHRLRLRGAARGRRGAGRRRARRRRRSASGRSTPLRALREHELAAVELPAVGAARRAALVIRTRPCVASTVEPTGISVPRGQRANALAPGRLTSTRAASGPAATLRRRPARGRRAAAGAFLSVAVKVPPEPLESCQVPASSAACRRARPPWPRRATRRRPGTG